MLEEDHELDLILTDMQMPGIDGFEFIARARELYGSHQKRLPYSVLCTADYSESLAKRCSDEGIEGKPNYYPGPVTRSSYIFYGDALLFCSYYMLP
jgi:CheY-like chemotaxis protein